MTELKPCPFCGGEAKIFALQIGKGWRVVCGKPFCAQGPNGDTEAEAISAWNTRAVETCENIGYYIDGTRFKCSNCGYNGWTKWAKDGYDRVPNYCPNCGAKVVGE